MENILYIMLGGGIGSVLRYIVTSILQKFFNVEHFATFWVNITGCVLLGLLINKIPYTNTFYHFLIIGVTASYTTFSTFEYENIDLIAHEKYLEFLKYSSLSCLCGFTAVLVGILISRII
ncbi:MAG: CrcB family protein [Candidatus Gastranaerophilales bacterium]|nr:CrcB family protein [Candidatus Gastranaerophilales bacterium]